MTRDGATPREARQARETDRGSRVRHAFGLLAAVLLLADWTGSGRLPSPQRLGRAELDGAGRASRLEGVVGVAVSVGGHRFERVAPNEQPPPCRGRPSEWQWAASRLHVEVLATIRDFDLSAWRRLNGHISDRPLVVTLPARGPPAAAAA